MPPFDTAPDRTPRLMGTLDDVLTHRPHEADPPVRLRRWLTLVLMLGSIVGLGIGLHAPLRRALEGDAAGMAWLQPLASAAKVPALFLLTVAVTLPALYVFNALLGPRLRPSELAGYILKAIVVTLAVLASLVPIVVFFTVGTSSYPFIKVLVAVFTMLAGLLGVRRLLSGLRTRLDARAITAAASATASVDVPDPDDAMADTTPSPAATGSGLLLFWIWIALFGLVGSQMAWLLRPFIGSPDTPFRLFRAPGGNLLLDLGRTIAELVGG